MHQVFSVYATPEGSKKGIWVETEIFVRAGNSNYVLRFQNVFRLQENAKPPCLNSSGLESFFEKFRFRDGLVWTVGLTVETKLRFRDGLVWTVGLTVEIKLRFLDGLVWTVGLTVEIKLHIQTPPVLSGRGLNFIQHKGNSHNFMHVKNWV